MNQKSNTDEEFIISFPAESSGITNLDWYREACNNLEKYEQLVFDFSSASHISELHLAHILNVEDLALKQNKSIDFRGADDTIISRLDYLRRNREFYFQRPDHPSVFNYLGAQTEHFWYMFVSFISHSADIFVLAFTGLFKPQKRAKGSILNQMLQIGINAFPIVTLLVFLIGIVIAMQSAAQLRQFGANIFVTDLIVISMAREMGPLITAIIISGRSGASIAAEIATMKVSEEIDALQTMGVNPFTYVIIPKFYGMMLTIPLLTLFADIVGILGGLLIAMISLDIQFITFLNRGLQIAEVWDFAQGIIRSFVFGWLIVLISSWYGMHASGGAEGVGKATTSSVVVSIFMIVVADSLLGLLFYL